MIESIAIKTGLRKDNTHANCFCNIRLQTLKRPTTHYFPHYCLLIRTSDLTHCCPPKAIDWIEWGTEFWAESLVGLAREREREWQISFAHTLSPRSDKETTVPKWPSYNAGLFVPKWPWYNAGLFRRLGPSLPAL